jgi:hypothetical protein
MATAHAIAGAFIWTLRKPFRGFRLQPEDGSRTATSA